MGDIKKRRKKYFRPSHPWQKARIDVEKELLIKYGLKNKKELWKMGSILKRFKNQVKILTAGQGTQIELEKKHLFDRLNQLGLIKSDQSFEVVLGLTIENILDRRLQTVVFSKRLARTINQARKLIIQNHICVADQKINVPSYLVKIDEENTIAFHPTSPLNDPDHPERQRIDKQEEKEVKKKEKKKPEIDEKVKKILTEEEIEAKEIEALSSEETSRIEKIETPKEEISGKEVEK